MPWMQIRQPGTGLNTWMVAAQLIIARNKDFSSNPSKWTSCKDFYDNCPKVMRNRDLTYVDSVEIDGKMVPEGKNLPADFNPLFTAEIPTPCGGLTGKYMEELHGEDKTRFIDLTTMEYFPSHPDPPPEESYWSGNVYSKRLPNSGNKHSKGQTASITALTTPFSNTLVINDCERGFILQQETERFMVVRTEQNDNHKTYIIRLQAKWPNPGFVFVGLDGSAKLPVFYRCHMAYGIKQDEDGWEDLDESPASMDNIKDTGSYLKYRDPNEFGTERVQMIPDRYTVIRHWRE
ncbi:hypothetical protein CKK34_5229 [Yarrowia sp. E02]|nr:hypothetical protein CKK34_5229 [Yarrowia sp. E02]